MKLVSRRYKKKKYVSPHRERVELSAVEREEALTELRMTRRLVMLEVIDTIVSLLIFSQNIKEIITGSTREMSIALLTLASTCLMIVSNSFMFFNYWQTIAEIHGDLQHGIQVQRGRLRLHRKSLARILPIGRSGNGEDGSPHSILTQKTAMIIHEYQLKTIERKMKRVKLTVANALTEDSFNFVLRLVLLAFARFATECETTNACDYFSDDGLLESPVMLMSGEVRIALIQAVFTVASIAYKLSDYREYEILNGLLREKKIELKAKKKNGLSMLDKFQEHQIKPEEINQVVELRKLLNPSNIRIPFLDLQVLRCLRAAGGDSIQAATLLRDYLAFRRDNECEDLRERILMEDCSWTAIPHMSKLLSLVPFAFEPERDVTKNAMVVYGYLGSKLNADDLMEMLNKESLVELAFHLIEWLNVAVDQASDLHGAVLVARFFLDCRGHIQGSETSLRELATILLQDVLPRVSQYIFKWDIVLWAPDTDVEGALDRLERLGTEAGISEEQVTKSLNVLEKIVSVARTSSDLSEFLSSSHIPDELGGLFKSNLNCNMAVSWDPWLLLNDGRLDLPLSKTIRSEILEISFFSNVESLEVTNVKRVQEFLYHMAEQVRSAAEDGEFKAFKGYLEKLLIVGEASKVLEGLKESKTRKERAHEEQMEKQLLKLKYCNLYSEGISIEKAPIEIVGNVNLLRVMRSCRSVRLSISKVLEILEFRGGNKVESWNKRIKTGEFGLFNKYTKLEKLMNSIGECFVLELDPVSGKLVLLFDRIEGQVENDIRCTGEAFLDAVSRTTSQPLRSSIALETFEDLPIKEVQRCLTWGAEYFSVVLDYLSRRSGKLVEASILVTSRFNLWRIRPILHLIRTVGNMYPTVITCPVVLTVESDHVGLSDVAMDSASLLGSFLSTNTTPKKASTMKVRSFSMDVEADLSTLSLLTDLGKLKACLSSGSNPMKDKCKEPLYQPLNGLMSHLKARIDSHFLAQLQPQKAAT